MSRKRQAAVAVLLGDRDDQSQVAAGQLALGVFVLVEAILTISTRRAKAAGVFQRHEHQVVQLLFEVGAVFAGVPHALQLRRSAVPARPSALQICSSFFISGWTFCVRIDSSSTSVTALRRRMLELRRILLLVLLGKVFVEALGEVVAGSARAGVRASCRLCGMRWRILSLSRFSVSDTLIVRSNGRSPVCDPLEHLDHVAQGIIAFEHLAAEALAGDFDLLGQGDFLLAGEQRDFAHLGEVHAHRIVDAAAVAFLVDEGQVEFADLGFGLGGVPRRRGPGFAFLGLRLVDQFDALLFEEHEQLIELLGVDGVVGQVFVDLAVGQVTLFLARFEQGFETFILFQIHYGLSASTDGRAAAH